MCSLISQSFIILNFYTIIDSVREFQLLHILTNTWYWQTLIFSNLIGANDISLQLVCLSLIFNETDNLLYEYIYWRFVFSHLWNACSSVIPIFLWGCLFCVFATNIFEILTVHKLFILYIIPPLFKLVISAFWNKIFNFNVVKIMNFSFTFCAFSFAFDQL